MDFLIGMLKIIYILAMVLLMALPFALEFLAFRRDKNKKILSLHLLGQDNNLLRCHPA